MSCWCLRSSGHKYKQTHLSGQQPAFIQAAAAENLIQMTSSFFPSDLSGILSYTVPPSPPPHRPPLLRTDTYTHTPPIQPSHSPSSSLNAHPASVYLAVFLSLTLPPLPPHPLSSCPPHSLPLPRALFIVRLNTASRLSANVCAAENSAELWTGSPLSLLSFGSCTDHISS